MSHLKKADIQRINKSPTIKRGKEGEIKREKGIISKVFNADKKDSDIVKEFHFLQIGYQLGISPKPILMNTKGKTRYIIMEELDYTLFDHLKENMGKMSDDFQKQMIYILHTLDENHIFHADTSPLNFMIKKGKKGKKDKLYVIDFGMSKKITPSFIKKNGEYPNIRLGITFFILRIRDFLPSFEPKLLLTEVHRYLKI